MQEHSESAALAVIRPKVCAGEVQPAAMVSSYRPVRYLAGALVAGLLLGSTPVAWMLWQLREAERRNHEQRLAEQRLQEEMWLAEQRRQREWLDALRQELEEAREAALQPVIVVKEKEFVAAPAAKVALPRQADTKETASVREMAPAVADNVPAGVEKAVEPPVERVRMGLPPENPEEDGERKNKLSLAKFFKSSLFIDSAVLGSSLLVPPSIPLTLAQSRLGRRLTGRVLKKTKMEKSLGGKIVRDVEDMPITQRRRR